MAIDYTKIVRQYAGQWVILDHSGTKVLTAARLLKDAVKKFREKYGQQEIPGSFKVPTIILPYVGTGR